MKKRELTKLERDECAALKRAIEDFNAGKPRAERLSQGDIADALGTNQGSVSSYLNGVNALNLRVAAIIAGLIGIPVEQFSPRLDQEIAELAFAARGKDEGNVEPGPDITSPYREIKIRGTAQMGTEGYWYALDEAEGVVDVPSRDPDAYALRLKGDSMAPAIRSGWVAIIEPRHRLVPLEYVMIQLRDGECMLKELLQANDEEVVVQSVNEQFGRRTIPADQIETIHYVGHIVAPSKVRL